MSGTQIHVRLDGLGEAAKKIAALSDFDKADLLDNLGGLVQEQTRARIRETKTSPQGEPWAAWSPAYAAFRLERRKRARSGSRAHKKQYGGTSLLFLSGALEESIAWQHQGDLRVEIGTDRVYGAVHQFGSAGYDGQSGSIRAGTPPRPYLGLSDADGEVLTEFALSQIAAPFEAGGTLR